MTNWGSWHILKSARAEADLAVTLEGGEKRSEVSQDGVRTVGEKWRFCKAGPLITEWDVSVVGNNGIV